MGMSNEGIVEKLMLWPTSVRRNVSRILAKLHLRDRVQIAVAWYKSAEWLNRLPAHLCDDLRLSQ